jgi:hypothetical protein
MGGVGNLFQGTSTPLHRRRGRHAPLRAARSPIPCRRMVTGRGMVARRIDPGSPLPRGGVAPRSTGLRRGRPAANPDRTPGVEHASRRAGHLLPVLGVVRGPGTRHEVRPAGQLRTRPCSAWPRSTGDPRAGRRRLGESERGHAWAAARITPHQASRPVLFLVDRRPGRVTPVTRWRRTWAVVRQPRFRLRCEERWRTDPVSEHLVVDDHRQRCHAQAVVQGSSGRVEVVSAGAQRDHLDAVASHVVERVGAQCGGDMVTSMG